MSHRPRDSRGGPPNFSRTHLLFPRGVHVNHGQSPWEALHPPGTDPAKWSAHQQERRITLAGWSSGTQCPGSSLGRTWSPRKDHHLPVPTSGTGVLPEGRRQSEWIPDEQDNVLTKQIPRRWTAPHSGQSQQATPPEDIEVKPEQPLGAVEACPPCGHP